jgi:hypothetical protein
MKKKSNIFRGIIDKVSLTFYVLAFGGQKLVANFTNKPYCEIVTREINKI